MKVIPTQVEISFIKSHRVARLATSDRCGLPLVIPICYVFDGKYIYTPLDKKSKRVPVKELKRIRNIAENPNISLVIDDYNEDWSRLRYIIIKGKASVIYRGKKYIESLRMLSEKYMQYREMNLIELNLPVIRIVPNRIISWGKI